MGKGRQIYRLHYRAQLKDGITIDELTNAIKKCEENIRKLQAKELILTAALYYYDKMLFLYYEALGEPAEVVESCDCLKGLQESGEELQTTCIHPKEFLHPIEAFLEKWPGQKDSRLWVYMYHIYYHDIPTTIENWKRTCVPEQRRGRIAFLRTEKLYSYIFHHKAIVDEGLLKGDRYQSIALHENILFSYFEEPKTMVNIRKSEEPSKVIEDWLEQNPESHFIHMPEGQGENFMFLPSLFAMGVEDVE